MFYLLYVHQPFRVPAQDARAVGGRKIELIQYGRRVFDVSGGEIIRAHHDAVGSDHSHEKSERLRIVNQIVVVESANVIAERVLERSVSSPTHMKKEMLFASCQIGKCAAGMRQDHLQVRILVERSCINEFGREESMFDGSIDPRLEARRPGRPATSESVDISIHLMKDDWKAQFLNASQDGCKARIENVIVLGHGVRQMDRLHAGMPGHAIELF